jgi:tight adherence protein B
VGRRAFFCGVGRGWFRAGPAAAGGEVMTVTIMVAIDGVTSALFMVLPMVGSLLLAFGIFQVFNDLRTNKQEKVLNRLRDRAPRGGGRKRADKESQLLKQVAEVSQNSLESWVSKLSVVPKLQRVLDQANVAWSASKMLMNLTALSILITCGMIVAEFGVMLAIAAGACVFWFPVLYFTRRRKKRMRKLIEQLPDSFELVSQALRAGHSLASGIQLASEQMPDPIGTEFARVFHEQNLGIKIEDAMLGMAERCDQMDVRFFVTSVLIQRQTGGDLAEVLDKMGSVVRDRIQLLGTVQALTAEGRLSGWVLLALPIIVFFVVLWLNPDYGGMLLYDPSGRLMLFTAIGMQLMGLAMIKKIVNIKV